jgi:hypothetical protein
MRGEHFFDRLARGVARRAAGEQTAEGNVTRRQALRLASGLTLSVGAAGTLAAETLEPSAAEASYNPWDLYDACGSQPCKEPPGTHFCPQGPQGVAGCGTCYNPAKYTCCGYNNTGGANLCLVGQQMCEGSGAHGNCKAVSPCEAAGGITCGSDCCSAATELCLAGKCVRQCPEGESTCGNGDCCPSGTRCRPDGSCECVSEGGVCGGTCCPDGTLCCGPSRAKGFCCGPEQAKAQDKSLYGHASAALSRLAAMWGLGGGGGAIAGAVQGGGPAAAGAGVVAASGAAVAGFASADFSDLAADPPDPHFRSVARPKVGKPALLSAADGASQAAVDAFNAMASNDAVATANVRAMLTAIERAQGAANAHNKPWVRRQVKAAANYAETAAQAYGNATKLHRQAYTALREGGIPEVTLTQSQAIQAQSQIRSQGLDPTFVKSLRAAGWSSTRIESLKVAILATPSKHLTGPILLRPLIDPTVLHVFEHTASRLRAYARRANRQQIVAVAGHKL